MARVIEIDIPIYNTTINVLIGEIDDFQKEEIESFDGLYEYLKKNIKPYNGGKFVWCEDVNQWCIWLRRIPVSIDEIASLVHEIEHCVFYLFQYLGMKHSDDSEEAYAYANEYLFREIMTKSEESDEEPTSDN